MAIEKVGPSEQTTNTQKNQPAANPTEFSRFFHASHLTGLESLADRTYSVLDNKNNPVSQLFAETFKKNPLKT